MQARRQGLLVTQCNGHLWNNPWTSLFEHKLHFQPRTTAASFAFRARSRFPHRRLKFRARVIDKFHSNLPRIILNFISLPCPSRRKVYGERQREEIGKRNKTEKKERNEIKRREKNRRSKGKRKEKAGSATLAMINIPTFHFLPVIGRSFAKIAKDLTESAPYLPDALSFGETTKTREK